MKVFKESIALRKTWGIKLIEDSGQVRISAVDMISGERIAELISFKNGGRVTSEKGALLALDDSGYDPFEYDNTFDLYGALIVEAAE